VFDSLKKFEGAQHGGKNYFVPVDWGNTSIIYRPISSTSRKSRGR